MLLHLYFSDLMCYFFKKIKKLLQLTFEKITCCAKREKKNNLSPGKIPASMDIKWSGPMEWALRRINRVGPMST